MKKQSIFVAITLALAVMTTSASAATYSFEDMIDTWGDYNVDAAWIGQNDPLQYTHDINDDVNFVIGDYVTEAYLELDFTNDLSDDSGSAFWGLIKWDYSETASYAFDGNSFVEIGEVDNGAYAGLVVDVAWLNTDGYLDVEIAVSNDLGTATAWLDHSRLYGTAHTVPVPGAALLGILGLGAAGMRLRKRS